MESSIRSQAREAGLGSCDAGGRPRATIPPTVAGDRLALSSFHQVVRILHRFRSFALSRAVPVARKLVELIPSSGLLPPISLKLGTRALNPSRGAAAYPSLPGPATCSCRTCSLQWFWKAHLSRLWRVQALLVSTLTRILDDHPILALAYQSSTIEGFKPPFNVHSSCLSPNDSSHCSSCI